MRILLVTLLALLGLAGCGPSNQQVASSRDARYTGDKLVLFAAMKGAVADKAEIAKADEAALGLQTAARWFSPDGSALSTGTTDFNKVPDQSINLTLVVRLVASGDTYIAQIEPVVLRFVKGRPAPESVAAGDASLPAWVQGRIDELQFAVYNALKSYEVRGAGGVVPTPRSDTVTPAVPLAAPPGPVPAVDP